MPATPLQYPAPCGPIRGTRLGAYEIVGALGAGGMGEVYRATDTRLKRQVAIKILPRLLAADTDRLARLQREAEVLASLNHPHIAAIYGLEEADGVKALVMELVEGPTLADRIAQGPIPVDETLPIAKQIAEALEAAHEQRIIHRDLKPANIKLRPDGMVKVLDFGLAKALEPAPVRTGDVTASATITSPAMTEIGVVLGTAAYMSPEQARGLPVDRRTDTWAFGCVLFEMLTGSQAFRGRTVTDVLAAVIGAEPEWQRLPAATPPWLRSLLRRCLQKDPRRRVHDIADIRIELQDQQDDGGPPVGNPQQPTRRALAILPWALTGALSVGLVWLAIDRRSAATDIPTGSPIRVELNLPAGVELWEPFTNGGSVALSPDGSKLAFIGITTGNRDLHPSSRSVRHRRRSRHVWRERGDVLAG